MDTSENKAHTFDFSNIFPKCRDGFQWNNVSPHGVVPNFLTKLCSNFNRDYRTVGTDVHPFAKDCQLVTYYLNHIYIKVTSIELNACCKYFFYKLKDLLSKYQWKCEDTKSCYEAMKSLSRDKEFKDQIYPLFSQCDSNLSDFNYDIYQIFKKLDVIYHALNEFKNKSCPNKSDLDKINNEKKFLERSQNKYSESFTQLLRNFNELFKTRVNELDRNKGCVKPFLSYIKEEEKIKGIIKILEKTKRVDTSTEIVTIPDAIISSDSFIDTDSQISTGVTVSFFAIMMNMFILYKYTPLGSYLQPKARALRKLIKRKNKKHMNIIGSYENMHNELNDKQYEIAYRSI